MNYDILFREIQRASVPSENKLTDMIVTNDLSSCTHAYVHTEYNCHFKDSMIAKRQIMVRSHSPYIPSKCSNASINVCLTLTIFE